MGWSFVSFGLVLAACGPGLAPRVRERDVERVNHGVDRVIEAAGDAGELETLLAPDVLYGGVWFPDAECRKQFTRVGPVAPSARGAFAACLAKLPWRESERTTRFPDTFLLTYEPGIELEVVLSREKEPLIRWIGYVSRAVGADNAPTVTQAGLEARRIAPASIPGTEAIWVKLCIDETGAIASVRPDMVTSPEAQEPLLAHVNTWRFQPFELDGLAAPVCAMVRAGAVVDDFERVPPVYVGEEMEGITVPPGALDIVEGEVQISPDDDDKRRIGRAKISGVLAGVRYCLDATGAVVNVLVTRKSGLPGYDAKLVSAIKQWRFKPISNRRVCSTNQFVYTQR